jgi:hypothetical protein
MPTSLPAKKHHWPPPLSTSDASHASPSVGWWRKLPWRPSSFFPWETLLGPIANPDVELGSMPPSPNRRLEGDEWIRKHLIYSNGSAELVPWLMSPNQRRAAPPTSSIDCSMSMKILIADVAHDVSTCYKHICFLLHTQYLLQWFWWCFYGVSLMFQILSFFSKCSKLVYIMLDVLSTYVGCCIDLFGCKQRCLFMLCCK